MIAIALLICAMGCSAQQPIVQRDDASITNDVRARLAADAQASPLEVAVDTKAGIVNLTGFVETDDQRNSVERIARDAPGVRSVDNNVRFGDAPVRAKPINP
jgi:hyperosmotically inducible protein